MNHQTEIMEETILDRSFFPDGLPQWFGFIYLHGARLPGRGAHDHRPKRGVAWRFGRHHRCRGKPRSTYPPARNNMSPLNGKNCLPTIIFSGDMLVSSFSGEYWLRTFGCFDVIILRGSSDLRGTTHGSGQPASLLEEIFGVDRMISKK